MADEQPDDGDYRTARQVSAGILILLVGVIVVGDLLEPGPPAYDLPVMVALLLTAAGLLAVDIPGLHR